MICYVDKIRCYNIVEGQLIKVASLMHDAPVSLRAGGAV